MQCGLVLYGQGKIAEAVSDFNEAVRLNPKYADPYYYRGILYANIGRWADAIADFNKVIVLETRNNHISELYNVYNKRGAAYLNVGDYKRSIGDFNQALMLKPDFADAYSNRAFAYLTQGNKAFACQDALKACELGTCAMLETIRAKGYCE